MHSDLIEIAIQNIIQTTQGVALFLGNKDKVFVIYVDVYMGKQIQNVYQKKQNLPRPTTHDLIRNLCLGFNIEMRYSVITDMQEGLFFSRVLLKQISGSAQYIVELDTRPSDAILLALMQQKPIFVDAKLFKALPNAKDLFNHLSQS